MIDRLLTLDHLTEKQECHFKTTLFNFYQDQFIKEASRLHSSLKFMSLEYYLKEHIVSQLIMFEFAIGFSYLSLIERDPTVSPEGSKINEWADYLRHQPLTSLYEDWRQTNPPLFNKNHLKKGSHKIFDELYEGLSSRKRLMKKPWYESYRNILLTISGTRWIFVFND